MAWHGVLRNGPCTSLPHNTRKARGVCVLCCAAVALHRSTIEHQEQVIARQKQALEALLREAAPA